MHYLKKIDVVFEGVNELYQTKCGLNGFGSTGKQKNVNNCRRICDVCHKFMGNSVGYILPLEEKNFVDLTHNVSCDDFVSFVLYGKKNFGREKT